MKILIINKSDTTGGAAIAAKRLKVALQVNEQQVKMLVQEKRTDDENVISTTNSRIKKYWNFVLFVWERIFFMFFEKSKAIRFAFSPAIAGENIAKHTLVENADVIHIHWFNQGFLSLKNLKQVLKQKKNIVWTLHDMWAFTGGCHYSGDCENYKTGCGNCKFLKKPGKEDLSNRIIRQKRNIFKDANIQFVTCSNWLAEKAKESLLLKDFNIISIPNPIDTKVFYPKDTLIVRNKLNLPLNKKLILFGSANIMDERKGVKYLLSALKKMRVEKVVPDDTIEIVLFGKAGEQLLKEIPYKVNNLGIINGEANIADIYSSADLFVLPSLEDNLPNTIMESLACGTPVVAFNTGGIPEMIAHKKNGYLADYKSAESLVEGIECILNGNAEELKAGCLKKVETSYKEGLVSGLYLDSYKY